MSKKDYAALAKALKELHELLSNVYPMGHMAFETLVRVLILHLMEDNVRFDKDKFRRAVYDE